MNGSAIGTLIGMTSSWFFIGWTILFLLDDDFGNRWLCQFAWWEKWAMVLMWPVILVIFKWR